MPYVFFDFYKALPYNLRMEQRPVSVIETPPFSRRAAKRLSEDELTTVVDTIAKKPTLGDIIQGTGGIRKARFALKGRGKRGGVRVVYYIYNSTMPVFLMDVFAKNEKAYYSKGERNQLAKVAARLKNAYGA